jgi:hypothetical protein
LPGAGVPAAAGVPEPPAALELDELPLAALLEPPEAALLEPALLAAALVLAALVLAALEVAALLVELDVLVVAPPVAGVEVALPPHATRNALIAAAEKPRAAARTTKSRRERRPCRNALRICRG